LRVPLPEAIAKILQRRFGDFSTMNLNPITHGKILRLQSYATD
jgi:hypothetical protein